MIFTLSLSLLRILSAYLGQNPVYRVITTPETRTTDNCQRPYLFPLFDNCPGEELQWGGRSLRITMGRKAVIRRADTILESFV